MSTILDALRKSERARRAGRAPVYGNASETAAPSLLRWTTIVAGLALVAALVAVVWVLQRPASPDPAEQRATHAPAPAPAVEPAAVAKPEVVALPSAPSASVVSPVAPPAPRMEKAPAAAPVVRRPAPVVSGSGLSPWPNGDGFPMFKVTIHVYTPDASQRILYINNEPRARGEEIAPGVVVEDIVPEGAVLQYRGQRYLLPRPS